jgi:hypothetical protein
VTAHCAKLGHTHTVIVDEGTVWDSSQRHGILVDEVRQAVSCALEAYIFFVHIYMYIFIEEVWIAAVLWLDELS